MGRRFSGVGLGRSQECVERTFVRARVSRSSDAAPPCPSPPGPPGPPQRARLVFEPHRHATRVGSRNPREVFETVAKVAVRRGSAAPSHEREQSAVRDRQGHVHAAPCLEMTYDLVEIRARPGTRDRESHVGVERVAALGHRSNRQPEEHHGRLPAASTYGPSEPPSGTDPWDECRRLRRAAALACPRLTPHQPSSRAAQRPSQRASPRRMSRSSMLITTVVVGPGLVARNGDQEWSLPSRLWDPVAGPISRGDSRGDVRPEVGYSPTLMYVDRITKFSSHVKGWRWSC